MPPPEQPFEPRDPARDPATDRLFAELGLSLEFRTDAVRQLGEFAKRHHGQPLLGEGISERTACFEFHLQAAEGFQRERERHGLAGNSPKPLVEILALYRFPSSKKISQFPDARLLGLAEIRSKEQWQYELASPLTKGHSASYDSPVLNLAVLTHSGELNWRAVLTPDLFEQTKSLLTAQLVAKDSVPHWLAQEIGMALNAAKEQGRFNIPESIRVPTVEQTPTQRMIGVQPIRECPGHYCINTWMGAFVSDLRLHPELRTPVLGPLEDYSSFQRRMTDQRP